MNVRVGAVVSVALLMALDASACASRSGGEGRSLGETRTGRAEGEPAKRTTESGQTRARAGMPGESSGVTSSPVTAARRRAAVTLAFGGDVNLGRDVGQRLLAVPGYEPLRGVRPYLADAALAFVNLESPLSEQGGETRHPTQRNVFTGPPVGARALRLAGVDVASVANNHAWDYGYDGFVQTLNGLRAAGVASVGGASSPGQAYRPTVLDAGGWSIAMLAATDPWNPGELAEHEAAPFVGRRDGPELEEAIRRARRAHDLVVVSVHAGKEYSLFPRHADQRVLERLIDAGADVVVGHHPHVLQGVSWHRGRPILHSLGNLVFGVHRDHPWTGRGAIARVTVAEGERPSLALCPFTLVIDEPHRLVDVGMGDRVVEFREHLEAISEPLGGVRLGAADERGCFGVAPRAAEAEAGGASSVLSARDRTSAPHVRRR
jgi:poly-gamma-glutamate synthesis protein (capsule biosynthesis protein)